MNSSALSSANVDGEGTQRLRRAKYQPVLHLMFETVQRFSCAIHFFIAGPNAFTFFPLQQQPRLGRTTLNKFDFEGFHGGSYTSSLTLAIAS